MPSITSFEKIREDFHLIEDWEDRYRYIIDLGKNLPLMADHFKTEATKVRGCASQVWIHTIATGSPPVLTFHADSDSLIVKGLIAILLGLFSGKSADEILQTDAKLSLATLGLESNLSQQRTNGLHSMIERINADARNLKASN